MSLYDQHCAVVIELLLVVAIGVTFALPFEDFLFSFSSLN